MFYSFKRIKLQHLIILCSIIFLLPLVIVLKYYQYVEQKGEMLDNFEKLRQITDNNIITSIKLVDSAYHIIEEAVKSNLERFLNELHNIYKEKNGDIEKIDLEEFKNSLNYNYKSGLDFYIIDENNVIIKTTYNRDLGLDFKKYPDLSAFFDRIRNDNKFVIDRLTAETLTGRHRVFAYLPTYDHRYILEAGCGLLQFGDILDQLSYMRIAEEIKDINPLVEYIRVYDRHGNIFGNPDYRPTEELKSQIFQLFYKREGTKFDFENEKRYFIFVDLNDPRYPTDSSKIIEVRYKISAIKDKINKAFVDILLNGLLIFLITLFVAYAISYFIDHPISKMVNEIDEISGGNLNKRITESNIIELNRLAHNINRMVDNIKSHIEKIKRQQEETLRLENQLRQSQKMEAIGLLAGGIAHDFNNIMSAILGYTNLLQIQFAENKEAKNKLDQIVLAIERGTRLIRVLLTFSRKQSINLRVVDLNEVISNISKLLRRIIGEDIRLNIRFSNESATVLADITNIEQVIMNLVTNARDAMPQGGELSISIDFTNVDEYKAAEHNVKAGRYVLIRVSDTGKGIEKEIIDKIFDPFFTTKESGKGTGLGLSIVYSIIKQHNGFISVNSELNKGTTFEIFLPYLSESFKEDDLSNQPEFIVGGSETILLVEDDDDIRSSLRYILEKYGYKIIEAYNGLDGYNKFVANQDMINLIITDVVMPEVSGVKMYERICEIRKDVKIIFMSGYSEEIIEQRAAKNLEVLFKPIHPHELLKKIREKLETT
ncbi:MAG: ATP-binding protein [Deltaproteobacteria bacterium]|nr:ATP-binding protein [Deltaproteobacteria bacterium]